MATPARNEAEAGRREQLLRAARKVFAEKGYSRATVADVVREAGVAQGTFYLYFPSKKAVLVTLAEDFRNALLDALFNPELEALPFPERGRAMVRAAFRVSGANPDLVRALHMGTDLEDLSEPELAEGGGKVEQRVTAFLRDSVGEKRLGPIAPEMAAKMVSWLVERACLECFVFGDGSRAQEYEDALVAVIDRMFLYER